MKHLTSPPDLSKLPAEYVPIVAKALAKNPAQRFATITEMAKAVEMLHPGNAYAGGEQRMRIGDRSALDAVHPGYVPAPQRLEDIPSVLPAISTRAQFAELSGSLAFSAGLAGLLAILYAALAHVQNWGEVGFVMFLTIAICWAVLIPAKLWNNQRGGDSWMRRLVMMVLGTVVGALGLWLSGMGPSLHPLRSNPLDPQLLVDESFVQLPGVPADPVRPPGSGSVTASTIGSNNISVIAGYMSYFALALCALRWWKMADRNRPHRFSCFPVIAAGFWALVLYPFIWPAGEAPYGAIALVTAAVIVQWVSPWEQPPPRAARRLRLRYA